MPDWFSLYEHADPEQLPWFTPTLDPDFPIIPASRILLIGEGPGSQAIALAKKGFLVTATDIAPAALRKARSRAAREGTLVRFIQDDILQTSIREKFPVIFDRGCFHVLPPQSRDAYVQTIHRLLEPDGLFVLKVFSEDEPGTEGPARFSEKQLRELFSSQFTIESIKETVYQGQLNPQPHALIALFRRKL